MQVPKTVFVVDEIKCSMCDFNVQPHTSNRKEMRRIKEKVMIPHAKKHTIGEFYNIWEEYEHEIWDGCSFESNLFSITKSHYEKTGEFWERTIDPKIEPSAAITLGIVITVLIFLASLSF